ncbi:restriction endonuclease subunit S [Burkholderia pseudomallei]|uniref:restriction endonuclease subunit S n=1 Tax=Burkholderia pseudomallei TaxID=28450 RepID=UPI0005374AF3|nr:restriction endonuclease subunit S [Burkholderia pseudomallei]KGV07508.1 type I restriction modification DNA specificity domain protein [Burkholderia pseudomallei MSHR4503]KGW66558.1 type I restriction modification DNA specificity domain protein [Burkholderia pseudomallei MSHR1029]CAJ7800423.1 restriction endonuclease S subunits-like protein [Burkholderia pseudomallei]
MKPGYKQTEVGAIPEDWAVSPLGRLVTSVEYGSSAKSSSKGLMPVLRMGNLQGGKIDWNDLVYTDDEREIAKYALCFGDVLFNRTNTIDLVGKTSIYRGEQPAIFAGYLIRIKAKRDLLDSRFLNYTLNTELAKKYSLKVLSVAVGQANINSQKLRTYPIPLPPTTVEQSAIATALSDVDALLSSLEALIAKKHDIKQAAMQQLLTGKTRLPGFEGEWRHISAGELGYFRGGTGFPIAFQGEREGTYPFYKVSDMNNEGNKTFMVAANNWVSDDARRVIGATVFAPGSIVFAKVGAAVFLERKRILSKPSCIDNNMAAYVIDETKASVPFIHAQLLAKRFGDLVATTALPSLNGKVLAAMPLYVPSSIAEQIAIAEVLSDMDAELAALEARRDKTRLLKQGMMQELLTGKTRLV